MKKNILMGVSPVLRAYGDGVLRGLPGFEGGGTGRGAKPIIFWAYARLALYGFIRQKNWTLPQTNRVVTKKNCAVS